MRAKEAREISITQFLSKRWFEPVHTKKWGIEFWYSSPIRSGDKNPSFKVDVIKNLRFDFWLNTGWNIIDLVCNLDNSTVKEALKTFASYGAFSPWKTTDQISMLSEKNKFAGEKEKNAFEILSITEIKNQNLVNYLKSRKIDLNIAKNYLKEIHFKRKNQTKEYYAVGFPGGDGFEVRNIGFKGFIGSSKWLSLINLWNDKTVSIFEWFMDFLAFLSKNKITNFKNSAIIINSVNLRKQALKKIGDYTFSKVYLFLDNDEAGNNAKQFFINNIKHIPVADKSNLYNGFNDYNQMIIESN